MTDNAIDLKISDLICEGCNINQAEKNIDGKFLCGICEYGTPEEIKKRDLEAKEFEKEENDNPFSEKLKDYRKKVYGEHVQGEDGDEGTSDEDFQTKAIRFLVRKTKILKGKRPSEITYEKSKLIFWEYYSMIVEQETKKKASFENGGNEKFVLQRFIKWLIGEEDTNNYFNASNPNGIFDPNKSIYLWGSLGTGKSTLALAGHYLLDFYRNELGWDKRKYSFRSMDELFLQTYSTQSLAGIAEVSKDSWCLDELREEHLEYKHYGQDLKIINDILSARHNLWKREGTNTIITTNISPVVLRKKLNDDRLIDRIKQQYIFIELSGKNKR